MTTPEDVAKRIRKYVFDDECYLTLTAGEFEAYIADHLRSYGKAEFKRGQEDGYLKTKETFQNIEKMASADGFRRGVEAMRIEQGVSKGMQRIIDGQEKQP